MQTENQPSKTEPAAKQETGEGCQKRLVRPLDLGDELIAELFENTRFGSAGETALGRRGLMVECILKHNAHYVDGSTIQRICQAAGLMDGRGTPTWAGSRWAFGQIYESGETIVERLSRTNA